MILAQSAYFLSTPTRSNPQHLTLQYLSRWLQESLSEPRDPPADGPVLQMVRVAVDVPLHRLFHDVQVVRGIEVARSGVSETNKSAVNDFLSLSVKIPIIFARELLNEIKFL